MQKKNPMYEEFKEETVWSMDRFNEYVNEHFADEKKLPEDWVHTVLKVSLKFSNVAIGLKSASQFEINFLKKWSSS